MKRYSLEEKKLVVMAYLRGEYVGSICRHYHVSEHSVYMWSALYQEHGDFGLCVSNSRRLFRASDELKLMIIAEYEKNSLSLSRISAKFGIGRATIAKWHALYKKGGSRLLLTGKHRGRPPKDMGRPKKKEPQTELEKLRERVEYLEAENALLKKVRALVEAREARLRETGQKPSTD